MHRTYILLDATFDLYVVPNTLLLPLPLTLLSRLHYACSSESTLTPLPPPPTSNSLHPGPLLISSLEKRLGHPQPTLTALSWSPPPPTPLWIRSALRLPATVSDSKTLLAARLTAYRLASNQCLYGRPWQSAQPDDLEPEVSLLSTCATISTWKLGGGEGGVLV